jgi:hypothetical protein
MARPLFLLTILLLAAACPPAPPGDDDGCPDADGDGVCDAEDLCPGADDSQDADGDSVPDACDLCGAGDDSADADEDGVADACDLCPGADDSLDADGDSVPDGCDRCADGDDRLDADADGTPDACDLCEGEDDRVDVDGDGLPDGCDDCIPPPGALDVDADGTPDLCENLLANGGVAGDVNDWLLQPGFDQWIEYEWDSRDRDGDPASGSLKVTNISNGSIRTGPHQCIPITPGVRYSLYLWGFNPSGQSATPRFTTELIFYRGAGCTGSLADFEETIPGVDASDAWVYDEIRGFEAPADALSLRAGPVLAKIGSDPAYALFDDLHLIVEGP